MATLTTYTQAHFPAVLKWQVIAFMKMEWASIFTGPGRFISEPYPPDLDPLHFVAAEGDALISYASIIGFNLEHAGRSYQVYGFGNMFTFPPYRREGFGRQVLDLATTTIQNSGADLAILFCDPKLEPFYAASGWQPTHSPTRLGSPTDYEPYDILRMIYFASAHGRHSQPDFNHHPLYIQSPW
jgi:predicted N-acetyltransferase YhbS